MLVIWLVNVACLKDLNPVLGEFLFVLLVQNPLKVANALQKEWLV
jgi:ketopantoate reductase